MQPVPNDAVPGVVGDPLVAGVVLAVRVGVDAVYWPTDSDHQGTTTHLTNADMHASPTTPPTIHPISA